LKIDEKSEVRTLATTLVVTALKPEINGSSIEIEGKEIDGRELDK
jgi:hypothetical protein